MQTVTLPFHILWALFDTVNDATSSGCNNLPINRREVEETPGVNTSNDVIRWSFHTCIPEVTKVIIIGDIKDNSNSMSHTWTAITTARHVIRHRYNIGVISMRQ